MKVSLRFLKAIRFGPADERGHGAKRFGRWDQVTVPLAP